VRGEIQLRHLLRLEADADEPTIREVVNGAVDTFVRAFAPLEANPAKVSL
jgi:hypothetical protein